MIKGLSSSFIENFQNTSDNNMIIEEEEDGENVEDTLDIQQTESTEVQDNNMNIEDNKTIEEESTSSDDVYEEFQNSRVIEPFSEGTKIQYGKHKLLLKSILAGILFYLLSSPQVYKLTKPYLKNIDAVIIHSLLFVAIHFFLNIVFN